MSLGAGAKACCFIGAQQQHGPPEAEHALNGTPPCRHAAYPTLEGPQARVSSTSCLPSALLCWGRYSILYDLHYTIRFYSSFYLFLQDCLNPPTSPNTWRRRRRTHRVGRPNAKPMQDSVLICTLLICGRARQLGSLCTASFLRADTAKPGSRRTSQEPPSRSAEQASVAEAYYSANTPPQRMCREVAEDD